MLDIQKIIVPVDFHQHTDELAQFAIEVASKLGAKPVFVHVVETFTLAASYGDAAPESLPQLEEEMFGRAKRKMDDLISKNKTACPECTGQVLGGDVADTIIDYAKSEKSIGLIVMGTHGARGIEKIMLGSVAERVLKRAHCPILVFNPYRGERGYKITPSIKEAVQPV
jgi:nucleotide-binding universal stress UspA family protein